MLNFKTKFIEGSYYIRMLNNKNESFFSDMDAFGYGIDFDYFHDTMREYYGKFKSFGMYDLPHFDEIDNAEKFIEWVEQEIIMNKLVR